MDLNSFHHVPALASAALNRPPSPAPERTKKSQPPQLGASHQSIHPGEPVLPAMRERPKKEKTTPDGDKPRIPKRIESEEPRTLEEAYQAIREQPSLTIPAKKDMATVAQKLVGSLRLSAPKAPLIEYPDADVALLASTLLVDLFGETGQLIFAEFIHLYSNKGGEIPCENMCENIREVGQPGLADFAHNFFHGFKRRGLWPTEPRISKRKADAVRQWDRLMELPEQGPEWHELDLFFLEQGYRSGETLRQRLRHYMVRTRILQIENGVTFGIGCWRPFATLVEVFGDGVLAFVPPWLELKYMEISAPRGVFRQTKLRLAAEILAQQVPYLRGLCEIVNRKVLQPACRGEPLKLTPAEGEVLANLRETRRCPGDKGLLDILSAEDVASEQALPAVGESTQTIDRS